MHFCELCNQYLGIRNELIDGKHKLFLFCKNTECNYKIECQEKRMTHRIYRQNKINDKTFLNKYKINDITLPQKSSKCPNCKKTNKNRFERKYFNNQYYINNICSCCYHNWT